MKILLSLVILIAGCANMPEDDYRNTWKVAFIAVSTVLIVGKIQDNRTGPPECYPSDPPLCSPQP